MFWQVVLAVVVVGVGYLALLEFFTRLQARLLIKETEWVLRENADTDSI